MQATNAPVVVALAFLLSLTTLAQAQRTDGLVLWWQFGEAGGTKAYDSSGNGNTGTLDSSMTRPADASGQRAVRMPPSGYPPVSASDAPELNPGTGDFTIAFWVRVAAVPTSGTAVTYLAKALYWDGGEMGVFMYNYQGTDYYAIPSAAIDVPMGAGTTSWKHLTATRRANAITTYGNGILVNNANTDTRTLSNTRSFTVGAASNDVWSCGDCRFRDVRFYRRALSAAEVAEVYRQGLVAPMPASVAHLAALLLAPAAKGSFFQFFNQP